MAGGYEGRGNRWVTEALDWSAEIVRRPRKPIVKVAKIWPEGRAKKGKDVNWRRLMPPMDFRVLPRRWVEHTFS